MMNCAKLETDIALYAGDDLPPARIARVEAHLAGCAHCRALAEELREERALVGELRDDPVEDFMVAEVRRRVLADVRTASYSSRRAFAPLLALAAGLILAVVLFWPHAKKQPAAARVEPPKQPAPATVTSRPDIVPVRHAAVRRHHVRRSIAPQPGPPLMVQFVTDDPNIVVYWLVDQKTQGESE